MLAVDLAIAGVAIGSIAALAGLGLLATYRATGVFNIAFGAIAMLVAYLLWQMVEVWGWPLAVAAPVDLLLIGPGLGVLLDRVVFRRLERRGASPAEKLVASIGVFVLLVGIAFAIWGGQSRVDAPSLVPIRSLSLPGGASVRLDTVVDLAVAAAITALLASVTHATRFGVAVRAVVDRRELAELSGVDADRVSAVGWAFGSFLAGLAGVLLAPRLRLDPYGLTLVVLETVGVVVVARLSSITVAIIAALAVGIGQSELTAVHVGGQAGQLVESLQANLFVVVLLAAILLLPRLREVGGDAGVAAALARRRPGAPLRRGWAAGAALLALPLVLSDSALRPALTIPALAIVFLSLVAVTGYSGQISLGQAGFAGLGALLVARLGSGQLFGLPAFPGLLALVVGAVLVTPVGLLTGWPAIRRRGLFLALTTLAVGMVISRFVLEQPLFTTGLAVSRPAGFSDDRAFYALEIGALAVTLLVVRNLHVGRLGRGLLAIRDDEKGARVCGVDVGRTKIFVFAVSSGLAALGGALLAMGTRSFDPASFDPIQALLWFAAVVVFGADSAAGAVLAAALVVGLDSAFGAGASAVVIGALAVLLGRMPGGVLSSLGRWWRAAAGAVPAPAVQLSPAGRAVAARIRR